MGLKNGYEYEILKNGKVKTTRYFENGIEIKR